MCSDSIKKRQNTPLLRGEKPWKGGIGVGTRGCQAGAAMEAAVCRFFWLPGVVSIAHGSSGLKVKAVGSHHLNKGQTVTLLCRLGLYMFPENSRKPSMIIDQASLDIWLIASLELVFAVFFSWAFQTVVVCIWNHSQKCWTMNVVQKSLGNVRVLSFLIQAVNKNKFEESVSSSRKQPSPFVSNLILCTFLPKVLPTTCKSFCQILLKFQPGFSHSSLAVNSVGVEPTVGLHLCESGPMGTFWVWEHLSESFELS